MLLVGPPNLMDANRKPRHEILYHKDEESQLVTDYKGWFMVMINVDDQLTCYGWLWFIRLSGSLTT